MALALAHSSAPGYLLQSGLLLLHLPVGSVDIGPQDELVDASLPLLLDVALPDDDDALSDVFRLLSVVEQEFLQPSRSFVLTQARHIKNAAGTGSYDPSDLITYSWMSAWNHRIP